MAVPGSTPLLYVVPYAYDSFCLATDLSRCTKCFKIFRIVNQPCLKLCHLKLVQDCPLKALSRDTNIFIIQNLLQMPRLNELTFGSILRTGVAGNFFLGCRGDFLFCTTLMILLEGFCTFGIGGIVTSLFSKF